ncbi:4552_t:CDS:2, partial [Scutellospora calospora]
NRYGFSERQVDDLFSTQKNTSMFEEPLPCNRDDKLSIRDIRAEAYALALSVKNANASSLRLTHLHRELRNLIILCIYPAELKTLRITDTRVTAELLKALEINILKGYPNSLTSNITILELENCHKCNEEILLNLLKAFTTFVYGHILYHDCLEKSNRDKQKTCHICFVDNEGTASAEVQDIDMSEVVENEGEETSNLTEAVSKLFVDDSKAIPRSKTKSIEPNK